MPRLIKCPSCGTQMDVGAAQPGSIVACSGCQVKIRIPTGKTSLKLPAVGATSAAPGMASSPRTPSPAPPPSRGPALPTRGRRRGLRGERTTRTRIPVRRGARGGEGQEEDDEGYGPPPKKSNTALIVGIVAGVALLLVIIIVVATSGGGSERPPLQARTGLDSKPPATATPVNPVTSASPPPTYAGPDASPPPAESKPKAGSGVLSPKVWEETINALKLYSSGGYGSEFYEYHDPAALQAFERVKRLGDKAYPYLVAYITDPEPQRGRAAVVALKNLNGDPRKGAGPGRLNPGNASQYAAEWKQILGLSDADVAAAESQIRSSSPPRGGE